MKKRRHTDRMLENIKLFLENYGDQIPFAFLFGSWAEGRQTSLSDIDIAIYFKDMRESLKTKIEHEISLLFDEQVNILRLEDDTISPLVKLEALNGIPIILNDNDYLNLYVLSIIHIAEELRRLLGRLRKTA